MGSKACKHILGCMLLFLLQQPLTAEAENTAVDLYNFFNVPYTLVYPEDTIETINSYIYAQKFDRMYYYVVESQYDETVLINRIKDAEIRLNQVVTDLQHGYSLSKEDIYSLESEYCELVKYIEDEKSKLESVEVNYVIPTNENTPSYTEYIEACNTKAKIESCADIGTFIVPMEAPVVSSWLIDSFDNTSVTFKVADGTSVKSLWNGTVLSVADGRIVISCNNEILLGYANMTSVSVCEGDTVYQGQHIGKAKSNLKMKLSLNDNFVDVSKLFIKE